MRANSGKASQAPPWTNEKQKNNVTTHKCQKEWECEWVSVEQQSVSLAVDDEEKDARIDEVEQNEDSGKDKTGEFVNPRWIVAYSLSEFAHSPSVPRSLVSVAIVWQLFFNIARMVNGHSPPIIIVMSDATNAFHVIAATLTDGGREWLAMSLWLEEANCCVLNEGEKDHKEAHKEVYVNCLYVGDLWQGLIGACS